MCFEGRFRSSPIQTSPLLTINPRRRGSSLTSSSHPRKWPSIKTYPSYTTANTDSSLSPTSEYSPPISGQECVLSLFLQTWSYQSMRRVSWLFSLQATSTIRGHISQAHLRSSITRQTSNRYLSRCFRGDHSKGYCEIPTSVQKQRALQPLNVLVHRHCRRQFTDLRAPQVEKLHSSHRRQRVSWSNKFQARPQLVGYLLTTNATVIVSSSCPTLVSMSLNLSKELCLPTWPTRGYGDLVAMLLSPYGLLPRKILLICRAGNMMRTFDSQFASKVEYIILGTSKVSSDSKFQWFIV